MVTLLVPYGNPNGKSLSSPQRKPSFQEPEGMVCLYGMLSDACFGIQSLLEAQFC